MVWKTLHNFHPDLHCVYHAATETQPQGWVEELGYTSYRFAQPSPKSTSHHLHHQAIPTLHFLHHQKPLSIHASWNWPPWHSPFPHLISHSWYICGPFDKTTPEPTGVRKEKHESWVEKRWNKKGERWGYARRPKQFELKQCSQLKWAGNWEFDKYPKDLDPDP